MESRRFLFLLLGSTGGLVSGWLFCTIMLPVLPCLLATLTSRWGETVGGYPLGPLDSARSPTIDSARVWAGRSNLLSCTKLMSSTRVHLIEIWGFPFPTERYHLLPSRGFGRDPNRHPRHHLRLGARPGRSFVA